MKSVLETAGKSIWKEVRELALKKGTETFVAEGIKSVIEIVKRRRLRLDEYEFAEWKKAQKPEGEKSDKDKDKAKDDEEKSSEESDESDEGSEVDSAPPKPDAPAEPEPVDPEEPQPAS